MKFRNKPIIIDAWQVQPNLGSCPKWLTDRLGVDVLMSSMGPVIRISTFEGEMTAQPGDWIIKGVKGELYPCKPDIFAATYEPVGHG